MRGEQEGGQGMEEDDCTEQKEREGKGMCRRNLNKNSKRSKWKLLEVMAWNCNNRVGDWQLHSLELVEGAAGR